MPTCLDHLNTQTFENWTFLFRFQMAFKIRTIWHLNYFRPFEYRICPEFRSPLYSKPKKVDPALGKSKKNYEYWMILSIFGTICMAGLGIWKPDAKSFRILGVLSWIATLYNNNNFQHHMSRVDKMASVPRCAKARIKIWLSLLTNDICYLGHERLFIGGLI